MSNRQAILESAYLETYAQVLSDLYKPPWGENNDGFEPHHGHRLLLADVFTEQFERLLYVNARNWGKTEGAIHVAGRISLTREHVHPNYPRDQILASYYVAPTRTLAREIIFNSGRIQRCVPKQYIFDISSSPDKAIWFTLDGLEPCGVLYIYGTEDIYNLIGFKHAGPLCVDEFAFTKEGWHKAKEQDFKAWNPLVMLFTTWPREAPHFVDTFVKNYKENPRYSFRQRPQFDNYFLERNNPGHFKKDREGYELRGEMIDYQRDVLSERVVGGAEFIFPNFKWDTYREAATQGSMDPHTLICARPERFHVKLEEAGEEEHVWPDHLIREYVGNDWPYCKKIIHVDPGHSTVWATNFDMVNPYTKDYFRMRELYLRKIEDLSVRKIMERMVEIILELWGPGPHKIYLGYDEAEKWFYSEVMALAKEIWDYGDTWAPADSDFFQKCRSIWERKWSWTPTSKAKSPESSRLTTIRDMMGYQKAKISHLCPWTIWETGNLRLDDKGNFPDSNNHTVDNWRYALDLVNYNFDLEERPKKVLPRVAAHVKARREEKKRANREENPWAESLDD